MRGNLSTPYTLTLRAYADSVAPTATLDATDVKQAGAPHVDFAVTYRDDQEIDADAARYWAALDIDVQLDGGGSFSLFYFPDPNLNEPPADLMKRGGAYYSTVATQLLNAHYNDLGETHVVNIKNNGAVKEWPAEWVLEIPSTVRKSGITPIPTEPLPLSQFGLISAVKAYELLTVEAAVHGDREAAYQALLAHPIGIGLL